VVGRYLGDLLLAVGLLTLVPAAIALCFRQLDAAGTLAAAALAEIALASALRRIPASERIQTNEAMVVAASVFVLAPLGAIAPFMISTHMGFLDALFEAVSAVTTTGLTTLTALDGQPESFLFTRAWMQWYGGLGIMTLSVALLGSTGLAARRLGVPGSERNPMPESVRARARHAIVIYSGLSVLGVAALAAAGATPFDGLLHALAGVSTGGFSPHDESLAALGAWPVQAVAIALGFCGAVSLPLYHRVRLEGLGALARDVELRALAAGCLMLSVVLGLALIVESDLTLGGALRSAPLLATSAHTTTGFTPLPVADLGPTAKLLVIASMLAGGSLGSTAGGVKLLRVLIVLRMLQWAVSRVRLAPHAISEPRLAGERLGSNEIQQALVIVLLFLLVIAASWLPFVASGYDPLDSLFEVVSAAGTVGLTTGISRPGLEAPLKLILCADMLLGRVEIVALLVVLAPGTWWGRRAA
jgi:trk system potassium uptake protein TrkH